MDITRRKRPLYPEDLIPALVTAWQSAGHSFGIDNHLQLRQVLKQFSAEQELGELKYLLAPIFADNPQKQDEFYDLFEVILTNTETALRKHEKRVAQLNTRTTGQQFKAFQQTAVQQWQTFNYFQKAALSTVLSMLLIGLISWGVYSRYFAPPKHKITLQIPKLFVALETNTSSSFCIYNNEPGIGAPTEITLSSSPPTIVNVIPNIRGNNICFQNFANRLGRESFAYKVCYSSGNCRQLELIFLVDDVKRGHSNHRLVNKGKWAIKPSEKTETTADEEESTEPSLPNTLSSKNTVLYTMIMSTDPSKAIHGVTSTIRFGEGLAYFSWTKAGILGVLAFLLWGMGWLIHRKRQKFTMEHQPNQDHPYVWNLRIPSLSSVDLGESFHKNLQNMLRREKMDSQRLDVKKTIKASLKKGGAIDFQYLQFKQSRQYLVLLDISSQNNHRAKILNLFIKNLQNDGAPIEYFFFDGDPRLCWNERRPKGISLRQLVHSYQNHHLIFCSDSHRLLQSTTGQLAAWTNSFSAWRKKLILTPRVYSNWDAREAILSKTFRLLPCTPNGISFLVDSLESVDPMDYKKWGYVETDEELYDAIQIPAQLNRKQLINYLEAEFVTYQHGEANDVLLRWIAACAIPPVMFWHWTLYVGQLLSTPVHNQLNLENLFQIIRLSWFVEGKMPEDVRLTLISWLEEKYPNWLAKLRRQWDSILNLEENLPPPTSMAWEGHRLEVILNELLQNPAWVKRRKLELELEHLMHGKKEEDAMVVKYLEKKNGGIDAVLSNRFRRFVQEKESIFWRFRMWVWQLPVLLMLSFLSLMIHYTEPVTTFQFNSRVTALAFTKDSESFLAANGAGGLALCTVEGEWVQGLEEGSKPIIGLSNGLDGNQILGGSSNNSVSCWDITGVPLFRYKGEKEMARAMAFHPLDPNIILVAYSEKRAELWNIKQGRKPIRRVNKPLACLGHDDGVNSVAFSPTGESMLTGSSDGTAKLWDSDGNLLKTFDHDGQKVHSVAFSPNGLYLATGCRDDTARIWDLNGKILYKLKGHDYDVLAVSFSHDGSQLVTAGGDDKAIIWSVENGRRIRTFGGHRNYITHAIFSPDDHYLLTGDREGKVKLWTLKAE